MKNDNPNKGKKFFHSLPNFYPSPSGNNDPYEIQKILQIGYGGGSLEPNNSNPNTNMYIDFYVKDAPEEQLYLYYEPEIPGIPLRGYSYINDHISDINNKNGDIENQEKKFSPFFTLVGVDKIDNKNIGYAPPDIPFVFIAIGDITRSSSSELRNQDIEKTLIHEVGHLLVPPKASWNKEFFLSTNDFHHNELSTLPEDSKTIWQKEICYFRQGQGLKATRACPRHVRLLRNSTARYFWYYDRSKLIGRNRFIFDEDSKYPNSEGSGIKYTQSQLYD